MDSEKVNHKKEILRESLAYELNIKPDDLDLNRDLRDIKWRIEYHQDEYGNETVGTWERVGKGFFRADPFPDNPPQFRTNCHCTTPIKWNHLVRHIPSGDYFIIGCECIKYAQGSSARRCMTCSKPNRRKSLWCKDCTAETIVRLQNKRFDRLKNKLFNHLKMITIESKEEQKLKLKLRYERLERERLERERLERLERERFINDGRYTFGPYYGLRISDVMQIDPRFIIKVFRSSIEIDARTRSNMMDYVESIQLGFTKYKNMTYGQLMQVKYGRKHLLWVNDVCAGNEWISEWVSTKIVGQYVS